MPLYNWLLLYNYLIVQEAQLSLTKRQTLPVKIIYSQQQPYTDRKTRHHSYTMIQSVLTLCYRLLPPGEWVIFDIYHIIKTVPHFSVYSHSDNNESKVIRTLAFLCDALLVLCLSFCPYSLVALNCDRRKICWSNVSSDIRQQRTVRTWAFTKFYTIASRMPLVL